ncbi:methyl-accepting chemotaxis protein [Pseudorhodoferax sp.]|uniref:methyl-accepting chemotaxis protein n=1 Tax=Pseudorhodoferax sp. TaxID=1993553 RepID=UPI002DD65920|nr:methyl-accepting chemotaxis protein [Pseudorhodoferax sp.]
MSLLSRIGIAKRLYIVTFVLIVSLGGVAWHTQRALLTASELSDATEQQRFPQLQHMAQLQLDITRVSLQLRHGMLSRTPEELADALTDIGEKRKRISQTLADYDKAIADDQDRQRFAAVPPMVQRFWQAGEADIALIQAGDKAQAFAHLVDVTIPARNALLAAISETVSEQRRHLSSDLAMIREQSAKTRHAVVSLVAATMLSLVLFAWYVGAVLRRRVATSQQMAEQVRDGNLAVTAADLARDEFSPLLTALRDMQGALGGVVAGVRSTAEGVASASAEIAHGNADLSQRTEEQASVLQQTASSVAQLNSTVLQNAESARQANDLAQGASDIALRGGNVVAEVVRTMQGINDSSRKVVDIISVIDSIAFQTNILALNAAVEAARAGEQGRGFAVVASEVRSLASRSADAAREIKQLISASVQRVEQGSALVDQAGSTMQEVVAAIRRVTDIMGEISSASAQQSAGVAQVGDAVGRMDAATQQNAALVEQSAAAAASLSQQAQQLVKAVAVFRLADGALRLPAPG